MQEKGIGPVADRDAATDEAIMGLLIEDRGPWATAEVQRMIGSEIVDRGQPGEAAARRARPPVRGLRLRIQDGAGGG